MNNDMNADLRALNNCAAKCERLEAENAALREREQQLQRALAFWHPGVRVDDVPEAATKRAADDACLLYGLEEADEQGAADLGWVAWVVPGEFARLRSRLAVVERKLMLIAAHTGHNKFVADRELLSDLLTRIQRICNDAPPDSAKAAADVFAAMNLPTPTFPSVGVECPECFGKGKRNLSDGSWMRCDFCDGKGTTPSQPEAAASCECCGAAISAVTGGRVTCANGCKYDAETT